MMMASLRVAEILHFGEVQHVRILDMRPSALCCFKVHDFQLQLKFGPL